MPEKRGNVSRKRRQKGIQSFADVSMSQVLGLLEAIDEVSGSADVATIAQEVDMNVGSLGPVVDAAEFLGLVSIHEGDIMITDLGKKLHVATPTERKTIVRDIIDDVPLFRQVMDMARSAGEPLSREEIIDVLSTSVGTHQAVGVFNALVYWGRYAKLVYYDSQAESLSFSI